ncbi:MAG: Uncharacterized protein CEN89_415 [Candidatus Berkelbacteria bacterium Licking1014_7]|uniref:Uncharacterized protein n=1 Tax=Candidatus Berkelbacteria bacterium Licking1014_7 TaxID=2017147 RepID=A0A554LJ71_9BACT|nr:MAG: Uncharacterized protein CEN89_415 [Candidatus Berkelbacteria bacterium Licking1014_7]
MRKLIFLISILGLLSISGFFIAPINADEFQAQTKYIINEATKTTTPENETVSTFTSIGELINEILKKYAIPIASAGAVMMIAIAGAKYVSSSGSSEAVGEAKELIIGAILGLAVILLAVVFIKSISHPESLKEPTITTSPGGGSDQPPAGSVVGASSEAPKEGTIDVCKNLNFKVFRADTTAELRWTNVIAPDKTDNYTYRVYWSDNNSDWKPPKEINGADQSTTLTVPKDKITYYYIKIYDLIKKDASGNYELGCKSEVMKVAADAAAPAAAESGIGSNRVSGGDSARATKSPATQLKTLTTNTKRVDSWASDATENPSGEYVKIWWAEPDPKNNNISYRIYYTGSPAAGVPLSDNIYYHQTDKSLEYTIKAFDESITTGDKTVARGTAKGEAKSQIDTISNTEQSTKPIIIGFVIKNKQGKLIKNALITDNLSNKSTKTDKYGIAVLSYSTREKNQQHGKAIIDVSYKRLYLMQTWIILNKQIDIINDKVYHLTASE